MKTVAIIPAAGHGSRMGTAVPKQYLLLKGKPVLHYTLMAFQECDVVNSVTLVVPEKDVPLMRKEWKNNYPIIEKIVAGGEKRQDSVYNGLQVQENDVEIVIVHDGARPFITSSLIQEVVEAARQYGAAITAVPVNDTIKKSTRDGFVDRTVDRDGLWRVQTPQAFRYSLLTRAFESASQNSFYGTDEGSLIEHLGEKVKIVQGSELNLKITRQEDLLLGEGILECGVLDNSKLNKL